MSKASSEIIEKFNEAIALLADIEKKDENFSRAVFLHQLINSSLDDTIIQNFIDKINNWINSYYRN